MMILSIFSEKMKYTSAPFKIILGCFLSVISVLSILWGQAALKENLTQYNVGLMQQKSYPPYIFIYLFKNIGCHYCEEEKAVINKLYQKYKDKIIFIGITEGHEDKDLEKIYLQETGMDFTYIFPDPHFKQWKKLNIPTFPAKLIMDISGRVLFLETDLYLFDRPEGREGIKRLHTFLDGL